MVPLQALAGRQRAQGGWRSGTAGVGRLQAHAAQLPGRRIGDGPIDQHRLEHRVRRHDDPLPVAGRTGDQAGQSRKGEGHGHENGGRSQSVAAKRSHGRAGRGGLLTMPPTLQG